MAIPIPKDELNEIARFAVLLMNEKSELSLVIIAGAKIEDLVKEAVGAFVPEASYGFKRNVKLLLYRGLIDEPTAECINILWWIRCQFAHKPTECSLADGQIATRLQRLREIMGPQIGGPLRSLEKKMESLISQLVGSHAQVALPGSSDMRFVALVLVFLIYHLLAAKLLVPAPGVAPEFGKVVLSTV